MIKTLKCLLENAKPEVLIFIFFVLIFLATTNGTVTADNTGTFLVADSFFHRHNFSIECGYNGYFFNINDGKCYSQYSFFYFVLMFIFYAIGYGNGLLAGDPFNTAVFAVSLINVFAGALLCAYVYKFIKKLGSSNRAAILTVLFLGFGTMVWPYTKGDFSELPNTLFLFLAIYYLYVFISEKRKGVFLASAIFMALAIGIKLYTIIVLPVLLIYFYWTYQDRFKEKMKKALIFIMPTLLVLLISGWYNYIRTNSFFETGYPAGMFIGFNPILYFSHIYGLLLSSGRSIFLFNIPLIIALFSLVQFKQKHQKEFWLIFSLSILYLLFIACFYNWGSLFSWGPRYLLPIVPLLTIPAYLFFQRVVNWQKCKKLIIVMLFIFCFLMQFSAVFLNHLNWVAIFYTNKQIAAIYSPTISVQFIPSTSPTIGQMRLFFGYFKNVLTNRDDFYEIYASQYKTDHSVFPPRLLKTDNFKVNLSHYTSTNIIWFKADYLAKIISRIAIFVWYILLLSSTFFVIKCIKLTDNL